MRTRTEERGCVGHIELEDATTPDGAGLVELPVGDEEAFDLDEAQIAELELAMAEADQGYLVPAAEVLVLAERRTGTTGTLEDFEPIERARPERLSDLVIEGGVMRPTPLRTGSWGVGRYWVNDSLLQIVGTRLARICV